MDHIWWRAHLRQMPDPQFLSHAGSFNEVDEFLPFLTETLDLPAGGRVLDLGCGDGAFSVRLAQWGYQVSAVEQSLPLLERARELAIQHGAELELRLAEMGTLPERSIFDGALLLDFGTFTDAENAAMMRDVAAALKPGSKVLFSTCNPYFWAREPRTEHRLIDRTDVIRRYRFDFDAGTVVSRVRCILPSGERRDLPTARYRAYTLPELRALTAATGLGALRIYGEDENGRPRPDLPLDSLRTPFLHCVALRPVTGESGEGI